MDFAGELAFYGGATTMGQKEIILNYEAEGGQVERTKSPPGALGLPEGLAFHGGRDIGVAQRGLDIGPP